MTVTKSKMVNQWNIYTCFTYAMAQHKGDSKSMTAAVKNIPYHTFNAHDNCSDFCVYEKDPANYDHSTVPGDFSSPVLFNVLKKIFEQLAKMLIAMLFPLWEYQ